MSDQILRIPLRYHRKRDGSLFPVELSGSAFCLKGRPTACAIVRDITERYAAQKLLAHNLELQREIIAVREQEQQRLGQDLHDDLCQKLVDIHFLCHSLATRLAADSNLLARQALEITDLAQQTLTQTRELARGLSPLQLASNQLPDALRELAARTQKIFGLDCRFRLDGMADSTPPNVSYHLYQVAQEAVGNAVKHAQAAHIRIRLSLVGNVLTLAVQDDGVGIPMGGARRGGRITASGPGFAMRRRPAHTGASRPASNARP